MRQRRPVSDEEMASKLVHLYLQEVARLGLKRNLGLDEVINAYYYAQHRLSSKRELMQGMETTVKKEEQALAHATRQDVVPSATQPGVPLPEEKKE